MNGMLRLLYLVLLASCLAVAGSGCNSDSGGSSTNTDDPSDPGDTPSGPPTSVITGTASGGAPITGTVYAIGSDGGTPVSSDIDSSGHYSLNVEGMEPPYILWAVGDIAGKPGKAYACLGELSSANIVNITPATHMAMADALNDEPATFFAQNNPQLPEGLGQEYNEAVAGITALLQNTLDDLAPGTTSLANVAFDADSTGVDAIYDVVSFEVTTEGDGVVLTMRDKATSDVLYSRNASASPAARANRVIRSMTQAEIDAALANSLEIKHKIEDAWRRLFEPFQDLEPFQKPKEAGQLRSILEAAFAADAAPDLLEHSLDYEGEVDRWYGEDFRHETSGPAGKWNIEGVVIVRPMGDIDIDGTAHSEFDTTRYDMGVWVRPVGSITVDGVKGIDVSKGLEAWVHETDTDKWLLYGSRVGVSYTDVSPKVTRTVSSQDMTVGTDRSLLRIAMESSEQVGIDSDIAIICLAGPGIGVNTFGYNAGNSITGSYVFPESISYSNAAGETVTYTTGLSYVLQDNPHEGYPAFRPYNVPWSSWGSLELDEADGLEPDEIEDGAEYIFAAFAADGTYIGSWYTSILGAPIPTANLQDGHFVGDVAINGTALDSPAADFDFSLPFTLSWSNPLIDPVDPHQSQFVRKLMVRAINYTNDDLHNPDGEDLTPLRWGWLSEELDLSGLDSIQDLEIEIYSKDLAQRDYVLIIEFD